MKTPHSVIATTHQMIQELEEKQTGSNWCWFGVTVKGAEGALPSLPLRSQPSPSRPPPSDVHLHHVHATAVVGIDLIRLTSHTQHTA